jgi:hypothetical protein
MEKLDLSFVAGGSGKWCSRFGKQPAFLTVLKAELLCARARACVCVCVCVCVCALLCMSRDSSPGRQGQLNSVGEFVPGCVRTETR